MRLLPLFIALLSLAALFISLSPSAVEANSLGYGIPCDVSNPILGSDNLQKPGANDPVRAMWWTKRPAFAGNKYTLRTADSGNADPTSYVPDQWTELYLRVNEEDRQFNGLLMYAETAAGRKVGEWFIPPRQDFRVDPTSGCVTHKNADRKNYLTTFRVKFPKGTGTVTIKALIKYGLAFPALEGLFLYPNNAFLQLTEAAEQPKAWFQGTVGQSCNTVCRAAGLGCDANAMKAAMTNPATFYDVAKKFTQCTLPLMKGCSAATPSVGDNGCYYHTDTCTRTPAYPAWERGDPCAGLPQWAANTPYDKVSVVYQGYKWYSNYYNTETPSDRQYGPWSKRSACAPAGGFPTDAPPQTPAPRPNTQIDCASILSSPLDGNRLCACSGTPSGGADPPTQAPPTTQPPVFTTSTQATFAPGYQGCATPTAITVSANGLAYRFSHIQGVDNPPLELVIGRTYTFTLDGSVNGHPFAIKTSPGTGNGNLVTSGVTNNNVQTGTVTFTPGAGSTLNYYQCTVHTPMANSIGFTDEAKCAPPTNPPVTTSTTTARPPQTQRPTTTTPSPNPCEGINCGANGLCSFGMCKCNNGFSGPRCEIAPAIKCAVDCKGLNRGPCVSDNTCGNCLSGFVLRGVNCVVECNLAQCDMMNRQTCTAPNTCGGCNAGFVERIAGGTCQAATAPPPANSPVNENGYKFEIGSQWQSGFCGTVSGPFTYTDDSSFNIQFQVPPGLSMTASWNLGASYDATTGAVTGRLPDWVKYGTSFSGGFCATFQYNPDMLIQTNTRGFTQAIRSAKSKASLQAITEYEVVISVVLNQTSMSTIDGDANFVPNLKSEVAKLIGVMPSQVSFLRYDPLQASTTRTKVSFSILCSNADQISLTSSFTENLRSLQATTGDKNNPQRATEYVALYPTLINADANTVAMSYPTQLYTDNSADESVSSAYSNKISFSIVALAATAAAMVIARW